MKLTTQSAGCHRAVQIAALCGVLAIPTGLRAITIDGNVQGLGEGYTSAFDVSFNVQNLASPVSGGKLFTAVNGNVLSFGLVAPFAIDDNLYGTSTDLGTPGWGTHTHTFSELLGSDAWHMQVKTVGGNTIGIDLDYIFQSSSSSYIASASQGDAKNTTAAYASAITVASSLQYNLALNPAKLAANIVNSPADPNWIKEIEYEWQIDLSSFAAADKFTVDAVLATFAGNVDSKTSTDYIHMSPNKLGGNVVSPTAPGTPPSSVPDGGETLGLLGLGMLALAGYGWRSQKRQLIAVS